MKMTTLGLVRGRLFVISIAAFLRASASALKLVEYFPVAMVIWTDRQTDRLDRQRDGLETISNLRYNHRGSVCTWASVLGALHRVLLRLQHFLLPAQGGLENENHHNVHIVIRDARSPVSQ